jgi:hypothetical protein
MQSEAVWISLMITAMNPAIPGPATGESMTSKTPSRTPIPAGAVIFWTEPSEYPTLIAV